MCNCISEVKEKMPKEDSKGRRIEKVEFMSVSFIMEGKGKIAMKTHSDVEVTVEGIKKPITIPIIHNYCPFCGVKY